MAIDPLGVATLLALTLLGVGAALLLLPVGTCPQCGHCRLEKLRHDVELEERAGGLYGIPRCPACGRRHDPRDEHPS